MLFLDQIRSRAGLFYGWSIVMKFLLVVFLLGKGEGVRRDTMEGWGSMEYPSEAVCLEKKAKAEEFQVELEKNNARAYKKKFSCEKAAK
jgi:hypothetical protein